MLYIICIFLISMPIDLLNVLYIEIYICKELFQLYAKERKLKYSKAINQTFHPLINVMFYNLIRKLVIYINWKSILYWGSLL